MANIKVVLEYIGTNYSGWQIQPHKRTIQGALREAIFKITNEHAKIISSGRTDAGTHARAHVANFHIAKQIDDRSLQKALNSVLPWDIRIRHLTKVEDLFHAQQDAVSKTYQYQIYTGRIISPFLHGFNFHFTLPLDVESMSKAAKKFIGKHNFAAFTLATAVPENATRQVFSSALLTRGYRLIYRIEANGFLRYMVRNIVGTLIEVGRRKLRVEDVEDMLRRGHRVRAKLTVPAKGLYLIKVKY